MSICLPWQLPLLASRCWQSTLSLGKLLSICSSKWLWSPFLICLSTKFKSKRNLMFQNYHSRQKRNENTMTSSSTQKDNITGHGNVFIHPYCLSLYRFLWFHPVSDMTSSGWKVLLSHLLSLNYSPSMRIFYQEIEVDVQNTRKDKESCVYLFRICTQP